MKGCTRYFMVAGLLTILNAAASVYYGVATWKAWSGDIWGCALPGLLVALSVTSLANVWAQTVCGSGVSLGNRSTDRGRNATPIRAEARGDGDV